MADEKNSISRRNVLAGLGTIGVGGALAGAGTSAFFSDKETFKGNKLVAGALDLKVDWEEHYYNGTGGAEYVEYSEPDDTTNYVGFPDPTNPHVWVHEDDIGNFMNETSIEAFPDSNNDGIQDDLSNYDACVDFADTPEDLDPDPDNNGRSDNDDTRLEDGSPAPLINLNDIKPGDFGEATLSFHLCDNPGYVWLQGAPIMAAENGWTESERNDDDEEGVAEKKANGDAVLDSEIELLDEIETVLWYDEDGDNVLDAPEGGVDVVLVLDRSGSMSGNKVNEQKAAAKTLVDALTLGADAAQVGVVSFANQERLDHGLSTDGASIKNAIDGINASGFTNIEGGVNGGEEELRGSESGTDFSAQISPSGNDRTDAEKVMVVLSDGVPNVNDDSAGDYAQDNDVNPVDEADRAKSNSVEMFTIGFDVGPTTAQLLEDMASDPTDTHFYDGDIGELTEIFAQISQQISGEEVFFRGSLRELLAAVSTDYGIPLDGDLATAYDELNSNNLPNDSSDPNRDCFVNSTDNFIGLAWWLPVNHANEIQTDSVSFDLGFYTEQCRHNDGSRQPEKS